MTEPFKGTIEPQCASRRVDDGRVEEALAAGIDVERHMAAAMMRD